MKFTPYKNHIEIKPVEKSSILDNENIRFLEMGEVISVHEDEKFFKVGDLVCFEPMGHTRIPSHDGEPERHVIQVTERIINGKYER